MTNTGPAAEPHLDPLKFRDPDVTAKGERRAVVALTHLRTLWFNTGSLCNIECRKCYMGSSPHNDRLVYITLDEVISYLDEVERENLPVEEIAFTGGEPFMNRELPMMVDETLGRGYLVLILTNAMKPLLNKRPALLKTKKRFQEKLRLRVSVDHYTRQKHEQVRGDGSWEPMLEGMRWLAENGFAITIAGRTCWDENEDKARRGYSSLFADYNIAVDAFDPAALVLFPEMDTDMDVPEITTACWEILGIAPETMMCATSRMVIKRNGASRPLVVPCTLLPYDEKFELGHDLSRSSNTVKLNHPHCARFCVLGGATCSGD